jgi:phosphoglycolate phosphatase
MPDSLPALIFDLDGTLTDSKPGILGCLRKVLGERGLPDPGPLDRFIGPPVEEWVTYLLPGGTQEEHDALANDYRACYDREGWSNNSVFPGIRAMLTRLRAAGFPLYICTSKREHFAVRILDAFELSPFFAAIYGDRAEYASHSKVDLLAKILEEHNLRPGSAQESPCQVSPCQESPCQVPPCQVSPWMIGDRSFDFEAARANRIRSIAAGWGYGAPAEWALADAVASTPAGLFDLVSASVTGSAPGPAILRA